MRIRLKGGELRMYAGSLEKYLRLSGREIEKHLRASTKSKEYLKHFSEKGLWLCINSIDETRRLIEPSIEYSNKKSPEAIPVAPGQKIQGLKIPKPHK